MQQVYRENAMVYSSYWAGGERVSSAGIGGQLAVHAEIPISAVTYEEGYRKVTYAN